MKAILQNGAIVPQEPLPEDWDEGAELEVGLSYEAKTMTPEEVDALFARINAEAALMDPEDDIIRARVIREVRAEARDLARKEAEKS